jgi:hypothetical protein
MNSDAYDAVIRFVSEFTGYDSTRIQGPTRLGEDLGVDGDDAAEFMRDFAARFSVDLAGFEFGRHFGPEAAWNPVAAVYHFIAGNQLQPIRVERLVEAAERGTWI